MIKFIQLFNHKKYFLALMSLAMILATILGISPEAIAHGVTSGDKGCPSLLSIWVPNT
jgi:hypothetical protein